MKLEETMHRFFNFSMLLGVLYNLFHSVISLSRHGDYKQMHYSKFNVI